MNRQAEIVEKHPSGCFSRINKHKNTVITVLYKELLLIFEENDK